MGFNNPLTGLNGSLIYPQIKSPNFDLATETGWAILKNGDAYFFNVVATGTITASEFIGTDFLITSAGIFFYAGTPAVGNLAMSWAETAGSDAFGNAYQQGLSINEFTEGQASLNLGYTSGSPLIYWTNDIPNVKTSAAILGTPAGTGTAEQDGVTFIGPGDATYNDFTALQQYASSRDGTNQAKIQLVCTSRTAVETVGLVLDTNGLALPLGVTVGAPNAGLGDNGVGELSVANATTPPTTNPVGGGVLFAKQGVPTWMDPGGQTLGAVRTYSADASGNLASFTAEADVPGATVSVVVTGSNATVVVNAQFDMGLGTTVGDTMVGFLSWNAANRAEQAVFVAPAVVSRVCLGRTWRITGVTAGTYVAKLRASCTVSATNNEVFATHTGLVVTVIDQ